MSELHKNSVVVDVRTAWRISLLAEDLGVSESQIVKLAVEFYEQCLDGLAKGLGVRCRDDIEEVSMGGEVE